MSDFEKLIKFFERRNYGDLIMPVFGLIAIIIGLLFVRKDKTGVFFLIYLTFDFLVSLSDTYIQVFSSSKKQDISLFIQITNNLIALIELLAYFYFFSIILHNRTIIKLMRIYAMVFVTVVALFIATKFSFLTHRFYYVTNLIGTIEFLFLLPPCFVYYYELFQNDPAINLHQRASFWIVTGIFFYSVISIPYYTIESFVNNQYRNWPLTYLIFFCIPFTINFIFLTKAFLCKKTLTI